MSSTAIEEFIGQRLIESKRTLATAESCTGGLIAHRLTNVSGISAVFHGGIIAYSNAVKVAQLGVSEADLEAHGAVSEPVAAQMAEGVRNRFGTDFGIAVTGIAGPTGGTPDKPVGLVYMAVSREGETRVERHQFSGTRPEVKDQTAEAALQLLGECVV